MFDKEGLEMQGVKRKMTPSEFNIKQTDAKLSETQTEIQKCQEKIDELQRKSEELGEARRTRDQFLDFDKKAPFGSVEAPKGPDFAGSMFNKRNQYSTVYDSGFFKQKDFSGRKEILAKRGLSGAGEQLMTQYQAQEAQR